MRIQRWFLTAFLVLIGCLFAVAQPEKPAPGNLTIEQILDLAKRGIPDDIIVHRIKGNGRAFDLNADEMQELKRNGLSDNVIKVMVDPSYTPPPPPPPAQPAAPPPSPAAPPKPARKVIDPIAEKVPPEPGVYYSANPTSPDFERLEYKTLAAAKQGGGFGKLFMRKPVVLGFVVGQTAKVQVKTASPTFYIRLVEKAGIEEYMLLMLTSGPNRRELELGTNPAKPVFPPAALKQSQSTEVDTGLFRLTASLLERGEYLFFVLGSADEKKGILAKGYEFGSPP